MAAYRLEVLPRARRELAALRIPVQHELAAAIDSLRENPRPRGAKALRGPDRLLRIRVGAYRVIYSVNDRTRLVLVVRAGNRRDVYRGL